MVLVYMLTWLGYIDGSMSPYIAAPWILWVWCLVGISGQHMSVKVFYLKPSKVYKAHRVMWLVTQLAVGLTLEFLFGWVLSVIPLSWLVHIGIGFLNCFIGSGFIYVPLFKYSRVSWAYWLVSSPSLSSVFLSPSQRCRANPRPRLQLLPRHSPHHALPLQARRGAGHRQVRHGRCGGAGGLGSDRKIRAVQQKS